MPIRTDKIPTGINNNIIHEYLMIPPMLNICTSPIIPVKANEIIGEVNVSQNKILPKIFVFFIDSP